MSTNLQKTKLVFTISLIAIASFLPASFVLAAENLTLRKGVSFVEDKDNGFPIIADKMEDTTIDSGKSALLFFGASGDLNTNRQAKRLISIYNHFKAKNIKFIVIDVDHAANAQATELIKKHYKGYIPCQVVIDNTGNAVWTKSGEASEGEVTKEVEHVTK